MPFLGRIFSCIRYPAGHDEFSMVNFPLSNKVPSDLPFVDGVERSFLVMMLFLTDTFSEDACPFYLVQGRFQYFPFVPVLVDFLLLPLQVRSVLFLPSQKKSLNGCRIVPPTR